MEAEALSNAQVWKNSQWIRLSLEKMKQYKGAGSYEKNTELQHCQMQELFYFNQTLQKEKFQQSLVKAEHN